jgi:MFS family permease
MERFGRKIALQIATIVFMFVFFLRSRSRLIVLISSIHDMNSIGAIVQTTATTHLGSIYAGRVLVGLGVGTITAVAPVYLAEMSPPAIRGRLVGFCECIRGLSNAVC